MSLGPTCGVIKIRDVQERQGCCPLNRGRGKEGRAASFVGAQPQVACKAHRPRLRAGIAIKQSRVGTVGEKCEDWALNPGYFLLHKFAGTAVPGFEMARR